MEKAGKSTSIVILPRSYTYSEEYIGNKYHTHFAVFDLSVTHAHFPKDEMDDFLTDGEHWLIGSQGNGYGETTDAMNQRLEILKKLCMFSWPLF